MKYTTTKLVGKVLYNIAADPNNEQWEERAVIFLRDPDKYAENDTFKGWISSDKRLARFFCPDRDFQNAMLPNLPSHKDKPVPVEITFSL